MTNARSLEITLLAVLTLSAPVVESQTAVVINPATNQTVTQPSGTSLAVNSLNGVLNAQAFSGADIGAKVNAAIATLPTVLDTTGGHLYPAGNIFIPSGTYSFNNTIEINSPFVNLDCAMGTLLTYTGSGDAMRLQTSPFSQVSGGGGISNCRIAGTSTTRSLIHVGDIIHAHLDNVSLSNATTGSCLWQDNTIDWTEQYEWRHVYASNCLVGWNLTVNGGTASDGYGSADITLEVNENQTGIQVGGGVQLYNSTIQTRGNMAGTGNTWIHVLANGSMDENFYHLYGETFTTSGYQGIVQDSGSDFGGCGFRSLLNMNHTPTFPGIPSNGLFCAGPTDSVYINRLSSN